MLFLSSAGTLEASTPMADHILGACWASVTLTIDRRPTTTGDNKNWTFQHLTDCRAQLAASEGTFHFISHTRLILGRRPRGQLTGLLEWPGFPPKRYATLFTLYFFVFFFFWGNCEKWKVASGKRENLRVAGLAASWHLTGGVLNISVLLLATIQAK